MPMQQQSCPTCINVYHNTIVVIDGARTHDMDLLEQMIRHRGGKLLCLP